MPFTPTNLEHDRIQVQVVNPVDRSDRQRPGYQLSDQRLVQHLETAVSISETIDVLLVNLARIVTDQSDCLALWACQAKPADPQAPEGSESNDKTAFGSPHLLTKATQPEGESLWEFMEGQAREMINRVVETKAICTSSSPTHENTELIVVPITEQIAGEAVPLVLVGCFSNASQSTLRQQWIMGFIAQSVGRWFQCRNVRNHEHKSKSLNDTIGLVHTLDQTMTIPQAALVIVNHLRRLCDAQQVALSFCEHGKTGTLKAISDVEQVNLNSDANKVVANACDQAIISGQALCYPSNTGENTPAPLALEKYCTTHGLQASVEIPLQDEQDNR
ncbi:MAG: hypothetical protein AB8B55_06010, partial [Mariniblastus sp.]